MLLLLITLGVLIAVGIPIAYSLGLSTAVFFLVADPQLMQVLPQRLFAGMNSYTLISLPFFILMGLLMNASGITNRLIDFSSVFVGRVRGGLGLVNVLASMLFGGISGSSASDTASIGSVLIPEMKRRGYPARFASGITVASSTMGMIIPPSIPMVLYGVVAQESIGRLFLGGIVPGILVGVLQLSIVLGIARRKNYPREDTSPGLAHVLQLTVRSIPVLMMPIFVVGAVVLGIATATESAALGVAYAAIFGFLVMRQLNVRTFLNCLESAILTSSKINDYYRPVTSLHLGAGLATDSRGDRSCRDRPGPGTSGDAARYQCHHPDRRDGDRCQSGHPVVDAGLSSGAERRWGFTDSLRGDPGVGSGSRGLHSPGWKLSERLRRRLKPQDRIHFSGRRSLSGRQCGDRPVDHSLS